MLLQAVSNEDELRRWLSFERDRWNATHRDQVTIDWIESAWGGTIGQPDASVQYAGKTFGVELKHWYKLRRGVCYKIRPVQRRYHHMSYKEGKQVLVMGSIVSESYVNLVMIRGDNVPLRDYYDMPGSKCETGVIQTVLDNSRPFGHMLETLTTPSWWS